MIGITFCAITLHLFFLFKGKQCFKSSVPSGFHSSLNSQFFHCSAFHHCGCMGPFYIIQTTSHQSSGVSFWHESFPTTKMPALITRTTEQKLVRGWQKSLYKADEMDCEVWFPGSHRADLCVNHVAERAILSCVSLSLLEWWIAATTSLIIYCAGYLLNGMIIKAAFWFLEAGMMAEGSEVNVNGNSRTHVKHLVLFVLWLNI